ncbi:MAG: hypothetical protein M4579_006313 [Chaenotheca gracillima]|nr:MAG: hypothetical protein M4579_006313 [Chaenotheca gracillima]
MNRWKKSLAVLIALTLSVADSRPSSWDLPQACLIFPELCPDVWGPGAKSQAEDSSNNSVNITAGGENASHPTSGNDTLSPPPQNWTVQVVNIPGLESNTTTSTTIDNKPTVLPVYFNSSGVGVIVVPIAVLVGGLAPIPPLPILLDVEGNPVLPELKQRPIDPNEPDLSSEDRDQSPSATARSPTSTAASSTATPTGNSTSNRTETPLVEPRFPPVNDALLRATQQYMLEIFRNLSLDGGLDTSGVPGPPCNASEDMGNSVPEILANTTAFLRRVCQLNATSLPSPTTTSRGGSSIPASQTTPPSSRESNGEGILQIGPDNQNLTFPLGQGGAEGSYLGTPANLQAVAACGSSCVGGQACADGCSCRLVSGTAPGNGSPPKNIFMCSSDESSSVTSSSDPPTGTDIVCAGTCSDTRECSAGCKCAILGGIDPGDGSPSTSNYGCVKAS